MSWERVYTVNGFWDRPRLGIADFQGKPHIYESDFRDLDGDGEDGSRFWLPPIAPELLALVMEDWAIWRRWGSADNSGKTTIETHPALPGERQRHEELRQAIGDRLSARGADAILRLGRFRGSVHVDGDLEVEWTVPSKDTPLASR
jgi:hypothetical protein